MSQVQSTESSKITSNIFLRVILFDEVRGARVERKCQCLDIKQRIFIAVIQSTEQDKHY